MDWTEAAFARFVAQNQVAVIALGFSICVLGFGVYLLIPALLAGQPTASSVAELAAGKTPASGVVELRGYPRTSYQVVSETELGGVMTPTTRYVPLVQAEWQTSDPVVVVLEVQKRYEADFTAARSRGSYQGRISTSLPAPVRYRLSQSLRLGSSLYLVQLKVDPAEARGEGLVISLAGLVIFLTAVVVILVRRPRRPRRSRRPPDPGRPR